MAEPTSWGELLRWGLALGKRALPERLLRWAWSNEEILQSIHAVHFEQWPRFYVREDREPPELHMIGFNLFNFSPFKFAIVGADLRVSVESRDWLTYCQRLPSEIQMLPFSRSGLHFARPLSTIQVQRLREHPSDYVQIRIGGAVILKSTFGELRKDIHSDIVATIDRDHHLSPLR